MRLKSLLLCVLVLSAPVHAQARSGDIVFVSNRDGSDDIMFMRANGDSARNLTHPHEGHDLYPAWSPGCKEIVFQSDRTGKRPSTS